MWQEIAVYIIGLLVILYVGRKIYTTITHPPQPDNPCAGCSGCALKKEMADPKKIHRSPSVNCPDSVQNKKE